MNETYIKIPLNCIDFKKIKSLEYFNYEYINASYISMKEINGVDVNLVSIYNSFDRNVLKIEDETLLFGRVLCDDFRKRGLGKVLKLKSEYVNIDISTLPDLRYSNNNLPDGNWFYTTEGNYFIFSSIETTYNTVSHLESISIYSENILRLRIVIELLKFNIKYHNINIDYEEFKEIGFNLLKNDFMSNKITDEEIIFGLENWLPEMLSIPLFEDIPINIREKINSPS